MVSVQLPGGLPLVQGNAALRFEGVQVGDDLQLTLKQGATTLDVNLNNLGGEFKGIVEVRDNFIPGLKDDLKTMAAALATTVNDAHKQGVDLNGNPGVDFFTVDSHGRLAVALTHGSQIAAGTGSAPGDNRNAQSIASLGSKKEIGGEDTFVSFYSKMTAKVGIEVGQNRLTLGGAQDALVQLQNLRDGKVGVSLEEEMINLIQFQKGFEASAKFLATIDEMMDTILSLKR
jgi:flagellar hook-associated protein 1 FlgK